MFSVIVKNLLFYLQYIIYELTYYFLGGGAMFDDFIHKKYNKCEIMDRTGLIALVTGGARGIGAALVKKLLQCNMEVIICCRNVKAGHEMMKQIREEGVKVGTAYVYELDLTSFKSIQKCAEKIKKDFTCLNILVNNAGIMFPPYTETDQGYESQWCVNYLGPFYLTHLLMPLLENTTSAAPRSRIVNVTSCAHVAASPIQFDNINMKRSYIPSRSYAQSKLAQILFTIHLEQKLREINSKVHSISVHPGIVNTELFNGTPLKIFFPWVLHYFCKNVDAGAISVLYPCISPQLEGKGGIYLSNCVTASPSKMAQDTILQKNLFELSLKNLNINRFGCV